MADTAFSGPLIVFGQNPLSAEYNPDIGTSVFYGGAGILDPRTPFTYLPGEAQSAPDYAWLGFDNVTTLNAVPYSAAAAAIVASANPAGATLTLVSANSGTTGVYVTSNFIRSDTGAADTGPLVALDAYNSITASITAGVMTVTTNNGMPLTPGMVLLSSSTTVTGGTLGATSRIVITQQLTTTGSTPVAQGYAGTYQLNVPVTCTSGTVTLAFPTVYSCAYPTNPQTPSIYLWNPMALLGRAVSVTAAAGATYATATISGYDIYGYPMSEAITISAGSAVNGKKAFKYIKSVVLSGGSADTTHAYSVGTADVFGLPLRADSSGEVLVNYATSLTAVTLVTSASSLTIADRTTPSTTTGDVRGTYAATSSTGANKLIIRQSPQPTNILNTSGLFGLTNV